MKLKPSKEVIIGFAAIVVLAASIWGYNFLKGKNIFHPTDEYYVRFDRVDGLIESGNVMYRGYKIGNITGMEFNPEDEKPFMVTIIVDKGTKIPLNSTVVIKQTNPLASTADLEIVYSDEKKNHRPGDILQSRTNKGLSDYIEEYRTRLDDMIGIADSIIHSVRQILGPENQDNIAETIRNLKDALGPDGDLMRALARLESITTNIDNQKGSINETLANLSEITADIDSADITGVVDQLNKTILSLNDLIHKADSGDGSLGLLLNDGSLYANLDSTSYYLSTLLKDLQENPKRYLHFSLIERKEKGNK